MNPSSPLLSRRGFLTASGTVGVAAAVGRAETTPANDSTGDPPKPRWTIPRRDGFFRTVVADGTVYALAASSTRAGDPNRANAYAVDLSSGEKRWSSTYPSASTLSVEDGVLSLVESETDERGPRNTIVVLDEKNGEERWRHSLSGRPSQVVSGPSKVEVANGTVFVGAESTVVALDAESGEKRWEVTPEGDRVYRFVHTESTLYAGTEDGVYAYSIADGTERWSSNDSDRHDLFLLLADEKRVYCLDTNGRNVYALSTENGAEQWFVSLGKESFAFPILHEGTLYHWGSVLSAIDVTDGTMRWQYDVQAERGLLRPIVADGAIFSRSYDGVVYAVNTDGSERWTFDTSDSDVRYYWGDVRDGTVYVISDGGLSALAADDGTRRWLFETDSPAMTVSVTEEYVVLGTRDGLYGFDRSNPILSTVLDGTTDFLTSGVGLALSGVLVGTGAFAAYRRLNEREGSPHEPNPEPDLEYGRLERIDEDAVTETYRVRKRTDDGPRVVWKRRLTDPTLAEPFRAAVERWADLGDRRGVVPVCDFGDDWVELPAYEDGSLADCDRPLAERIDALSAASASIHEAHRDGLVHGGLTPETILLDGDTVHMSDWELATALAEHRDPSPYDAPEQVHPRDSDGSGDSGGGRDCGGGDSDGAVDSDGGREGDVEGDRSVDERTDVYRLGAIAHFVMTGKAPADGDPDVEDRPLSPEVDDVLSTAMADDPDERYRSVVKFDDMLRWAAFRA
ncbi:outer membrane protein assembly factor BamB family protein [Haladaptatus sp. NG-WS-4]